MNNILFLDIETVPQVWKFNELNHRTQEIFKKKYRKDIAEASQNLISFNFPPSENFERACQQVWQENASFHAEFCKIVCVSIGQVRTVAKPIAQVELQLKTTDTDTPIKAAVVTQDELEIGTKSFYSHDEKVLMRDVSVFLEKNNGFELCAHNGKGFDYPMLSKKMLIHGFRLPPQLQIMGLKPWEIKLLDTAEMWRFGNMKDYTSLDSIANCFGLPSPKETMDGSMVGTTYYGIGELTPDRDAALKKICIYCEQGDVVTLVNVYRCIKGHDPIKNHKSLTT